MAQGRKSKAKDRHGVAKFERPLHLIPEEAAEWDRICKSQSPDWFVSGAEILLEAYVVSVCYLRTLHKQRRTMAADPENKAVDLIGISEGIAAEARQLITLARQLRLTQQSRIRADGARDVPQLPWQDEDEDGTG